jgi:hypothetical protein
VTRVCEHVPGRAYVERFTGVGVESDLLCEACAEAPATIDADDELVARVRDDTRVRFVGEPQVLELPSELELEVDAVAIDCPTLMDLKPFGTDDRARWLGLASDGRVLELDLDRGEVRERARVDLAGELHVSGDGRYIAVVEDHGLRGVIVELATGREMTRLVRTDYHARQCRFPFAFVTRGDRQLAVFGPEWNRLSIFDVATNEALSARPRIPARERHYLDYFHSGLHVSPAQTMLADTGWVWHPVGVIATWSIDRWLSNVWESDDGPSRRDAAYREAWDMPLCWLDERRIAVAGRGDLESLFPHAVEIVDAHTSRVERWFAGPDPAALAFDRLLVSLGESTTVWDVDRGGCLLRSPHRLARYHSTAKLFAALPADGRIMVARLRGLDADAAWATDRVRAVAASIDDPAAQLGVLGDALDDAGCTDDELLAHCRSPGPHGRRCWALDRLARR